MLKKRIRRIIPKKQINFKIFWVHKLKKVIKIAPIITVGFIIIIAFVFLSTLSILQIKINIINNIEYVDNDNMLKKIYKTIYLFPDRTVIKNSILKNEWVRDVKISRKWNTFNIELLPQTIYFNWRNVKNNKQGYINSLGVLFNPKHMHKNNKELIVSNIDDVKIAFSNLKKYKKILTTKIKIFSKTEIEALITIGGTKIILGQKLQEKRLNRFQKYHHLFKMRNNSIVDLRYDNGFAKTN